MPSHGKMGPFLGRSQKRKKEKEKEKEKERTKTKTKTKTMTKKNKAGYTATLVACRWAGGHLGMSRMLIKLKNAKKSYRSLNCHMDSGTRCPSVIHHHV